MQVERAAIHNSSNKSSSLTVTSFSGAFVAKVILVLYFLPVILLAAVPTYILLRKWVRYPELGRRRVVAICLLAGIALLPIIIQLDFLRGYTLKVVTLAVLTEKCDIPDGPVLWLQHISEPEFGACPLCDDSGPPFGYEEYRSLFCPWKNGAKGKRRSATTPNSSGGRVCRTLCKRKNEGRGRIRLPAASGEAEREVHDTNLDLAE